jgi:hypothetical protein
MTNTYDIDGDDDDYREDEELRQTIPVPASVLDAPELAAALRRGAARVRGPSAPIPWDAGRGCHDSDGSGYWDAGRGCDELIRKGSIYPGFALRIEWPGRWQAELPCWLHCRFQFGRWQVRTSDGGWGGQPWVMVSGMTLPYDPSAPCADCSANEVDPAAGGGWVVSITSGGGPVVGWHHQLVLAGGHDRRQVEAAAKVIDKAVGAAYAAVCVAVPGTPTAADCDAGNALIEECTRRRGVVLYRCMHPIARCYDSTLDAERDGVPTVWRLAPASGASAVSAAPLPTAVYASEERARRARQEWLATATRPVGPPRSC